MFKEYKVKLKFQNEFAAGIPEDPNQLLSFLEARQPRTKPEGATPIEELAKGVAEEILAPETGGEAAITTTFKVKDGVLVYEARGVKSHIKDCANVLKEQLGVKGLKAKVADRLQVEPQFIKLHKDGKELTAPDGREIRPITTMTRQGPITAVKIVNYLMQPEMEFTLLVLDDGLVTKELLETLMTYGGRIKGLGQDRNLGWGRYRFEIEEA